jgi:hypothetical protein
MKYKYLIMLTIIYLKLSQAYIPVLPFSLVSKLIHDNITGTGGYTNYSEIVQFTNKGIIRGIIPYARGADDGLKEGQPIITKTDFYDSPELKRVQFHRSENDIIMSFKYSGKKEEVVNFWDTEPTDQQRVGMFAIEFQELYHTGKFASSDFSFSHSVDNRSDNYLQFYGDRVTYGPLGEANICYYHNLKHFEVVPANTSLFRRDLTPEEVTGIGMLPGPVSYKLSYRCYGNKTLMFRELKVDPYFLLGMMKVQARFDFREKKLSLIDIYPVKFFNENNIDQVIFGRMGVTVYDPDKGEEGIAYRYPNQDKETALEDDYRYKLSEFGMMYNNNNLIMVFKHKISRRKMEVKTVTINLTEETEYQAKLIATELSWMGINTDFKQFKVGELSLEVKDGKFEIIFYPDRMICKYPKRKTQDYDYNKLMTFSIVPKDDKMFRRSMNHDEVISLLQRPQSKENAFVDFEVRYRNEYLYGFPIKNLSIRIDLLILLLKIKDKFDGARSRLDMQETKLREIGPEALAMLENNQDPSNPKLAENSNEGSIDERMDKNFIKKGKSNNELTDSNEPIEEKKEGLNQRTWENGLFDNHEQQEYTSERKIPKTKKAKRETSSIEQRKESHKDKKPIKKKKTTEESGISGDDGLVGLDD